MGKRPRATGGHAGEWKTLYIYSTAVRIGGVGKIGNAMSQTVAEPVPTSPKMMSVVKTAETNGKGVSQ